MTTIIDKNKIIQYIGTDETRLNELLLIFAEDLRTHVRQLQTLTTDDWLKHQRLLHRMIGSASYFGTDDLKECVKQAEHWCRRQDAVQLNLALTQLYHEVERVLSCDLMKSL